MGLKCRYKEKSKETNEKRYRPAFEMNGSLYK